jgi:hypothetical protein
MSFLPPELSARLLGIVKAASEFGKNTHENVDRFMKEIRDQLIV